MADIRKPTRKRSKAGKPKSKRRMFNPDARQRIYLDKWFGGTARGKDYSATIGESMILGYGTLFNTADMERQAKSYAVQERTMRQSPDDPVRKKKQRKAKRADGVTLHLNN
jgi:hypothetical protein